MAFIDTFAKYHTLSKYPVDEGTSLANVRNKSGHTVTTSDIWASEIPAFFVVYDDETRNSLAAKEGDLCTQGSQLYEYKDGAWSARNALVDGEVIGGVIKYHKGCKAVILTDTNNSGTGGNGYSVRIRPNGAAATDPFIESFISSMDKVVNGIPSMGYNPVVHDTTSATGFRDEGTGTNDFIANCYGGVITFNTKRTDAETKITIDVFEYVGDKLNTTLGNIREEIQDIVGVTMEGVVASVGTNDAATSAGIGVDSTSKTSPKITFTAGSVTTGETKLVSGGAVAAVTDALSGRIAQLEGIAHFSVVVVPEGQTIENVNPLVENTIYLVKDAKAAEGTYIEYIAYKPAGSETVVTEKIGSTAIDLSGYTTDGEHTALAERVTALDAATTGRVSKVESEISTLKTTTIPAAITTAQGYTDTKIAEELETGGSIAQAINAAKEAAIANAKVTLTAGNGITIPNSGSQDTAFTVSVDTDVIATKQSVDDLSGIVTALSETVGSNKTEVDGKISAIEGKLGATGEIGQAIADVKATADSAVQSVTRATGSSTLLTVTDGTDVTISLSTEVATKSDITTEINKLSATGGAITALDGRVDAIETSLAAGGTTAEAIAAAKKAGTDAQTAADAKVADVTVDGTSIVSGAAGSKTVALTTTKAVAITPSADSASTALATEASVAKALASITSVGVSYEVIPDGQTHTSITAPVNGRIYLEKDTTNAEAGVYIEWMYTEKGWEQIGSTKTDHSTYASKITINGSEKSVANSAVDLGAFASSVTAGNGVASGSVSATGALSLTLTTASTSTVGITKLDSTIAGSTSETTAATPKAVKEYADTKVGDVQWFNGADLISTKAEIVDGKLVVTEQEVTNDRKGQPNGWNIAITKVVNNECFIGDEKFATVEFDKMKKQDGFFYDAVLSEFSSDLSALENGYGMFGHTQLTQFVGDLSSLTYGHFMFGTCPNLIEFIGDLSSLTDGRSMFNYSTNLTTFTSDLSSLTYGWEMFKLCKLNVESLECIADTINEHEGNITISWYTLPEEDKRQELVDELSRIVDKGWTLETNPELLPLFDSEKYETGEKTVQPLDLDSEPQTVYYVVKK